LFKEYHTSVFMAFFGDLGILCWHALAWHSLIKECQARIALVFFVTTLVTAGFRWFWSQRMPARGSWSGSPRVLFGDGDHIDERAYY
jgi:hypothetical protein